MIAEIHNKISASGSNLNDRREDLLTGDVFGSLRYLPFEVGYLPVLSRVTFRSAVDQQRWNETISLYNCENADINFWEHLGQGEIDVVMSGPQRSIVGFEVKYLSWLSSDDDVSNEDTTESLENYETSINQLATYARSLAERSNNCFLILVAPRDKGSYIVDDVTRRRIVNESVPLGLLLWESVYEVCLVGKDISTNHCERHLFQDLVALLEKRNLQTFTGWGIQQIVTNASYQFQPTDVAFDWESEKVKGDLCYVFERRDR